MGKLDEFFRGLKGEKKRSELEVLEKIETYLEGGGIDEAITLLDELEKEHNIFLALRMIIQALTESLDEAERMGGLPDHERERIKERIKSLVPAVNGLLNRRYRAVLLSDLAILFYRLNDELNGDVALKAAINLAEDEADIVRDVLMELIRRGLLNKAAYAMKMVKEPEKLDVVLTHIAEGFYRAGEVEKAMLILKHIANPFHRAMALYYMASIEGERDREKALKLIEAAFKEVEKIEDPDARFELSLKLYDLRHFILGEGFNVRGVLSWREAPQE
jgi:tetratricopeptide (TPR) repeat protein